MYALRPEPARVHARTFHALCASAFALTGLGGLVMMALAPSHHDGHGLLLAVLLAAAFAVTAWLQPAPASVCGLCGGPRGRGFGFCVTCGVREAAPVVRKS